MAIVTHDVYDYHHRLLLTIIILIARGRSCARPLSGHTHTPEQARRVMHGMLMFGVPGGMPGACSASRGGDLPIPFIGTISGATPERGAQVGDGGTFA